VVQQGQMLDGKHWTSLLSAAKGDGIAHCGQSLISTIALLFIVVCVVCFQVYKSALPSHTVYTLNMERILNRMTHPSHEELEQDEIYQQEVNLKRELNNRQRLLCAETSIAM